MASVSDSTGSVILPRSPFSDVLSAHIPVLPAVLRDHYLVAPDMPYRIVLDGTMNRIWHRPTWLRPFFWLLTWADVLFPETGTNIPATMAVTGRCSSTGQGYQTWERTFTFRKQRRFNAEMVYDADRECVVERLGPAHLLEMAWDVRFVPSASIEIVTTGCAIQLGQWSIALPRLLYPSVRAVETAVSDHVNTIHIDLEIVHPWIGPVFGYDGTFTLRHQPFGTAA